MAFLLLVFNAADFNLDRFVEEFLVLLAGAGEQERVGDGGVALIDTGDDVRTADPVRLGKIRLRPLRGTIRVRVIEANDVQTLLACLALDADELLGRDVEAVVRAVGAGVAGADDLADVVAIRRSVAQQHAAALVRIGLFAVRAQGRVVGVAEIQHYPSRQNRSLRYLSAESERTVTMTASRPARASCSAICSDAVTAPAAETPTSRPSRRPSSRAMA